MRVGEGLHPLLVRGKNSKCVCPAAQPLPDHTHTKMAFRVDLSALKQANASR